MPELVVRDESGRELPWSPQDGGSSTSEADGEVEVRGHPEAGELEVEATSLVSLMFDEEAGDEVTRDSYNGPWVFRFSNLAPPPTRAARSLYPDAVARLREDEEQG